MTLTMIAMVILGVVILESLCWWAVRILKPRFVWLITEDDRKPQIAPDVVDAYLQRSFDPLTGWRRKAGQSGKDETEVGPALFKISEGGWRANPTFSERPTKFLAFGDSYTFCRLVNDTETWPYYLSVRLNAHVANFGIGNFGLDQALLLAEEEVPYYQPDVVVMGVVPETIARCRGRWKHYFEYGNTLAFKPSFRLTDSGLEAVDSPVRKREDFQLSDRDLLELEKTDYFFDRKFRNDILKFPYLISILRRLSRNAPIFWHLLTTHFMSEKSRQVGWRKAFEVILRENAKETAALYKEGGSTALLAALIERFAKLCETHGSRPVLLIIPQPSDLSRKNGETPYREFFHTLECSIDVLDMTEAFSNHKEPNLLYVGGALGPHCSVEGNRLIADALNNLICAFPSGSKYFHCGTERTPKTDNLA